MPELNWIAILVAAGSSFMLGGLWYSPKMFGAAWGRAAGIDAKCEKTGHPARVFALSFVFSVIAAALFAWWIGAHPTVGFAVGRGLLVGLGFVATCFGINYQFANRKTLLWAIDGGYHTAQFALFGLVLGLFG